MVRGLLGMGMEATGKRKTILAALLMGGGLLIPGNGFSAGWGRIGADVNFWAQETEGFLQENAGTIPGTNVNLEITLGLDTNQVLPDARIWMGSNRMRLLLSYSEIRFDGIATLEEELTISGQTFSIGEEVRSQVESSVLGIYFNQTLLNLQGFEFGYQIGVDIIDHRALIESTLSGREEISGTIPLPVGGIHLGWKPGGSMRIFAEVSAMSASVGGNEFHLTDGRGQWEFHFRQFFGMHVGYRFLDIEVDSEEIGDLSLTQNGPFLGMTVRF